MSSVEIGLVVCVCVIGKAGAGTEAGTEDGLLHEC